MLQRNKHLVPTVKEKCAPGKPQPTCPRTGCSCSMLGLGSFVCKRQQQIVVTTLDTRRAWRVSWARCERCLTAPLVLQDRHGKSEEAVNVPEGERQVRAVLQEGPLRALRAVLHRHLGDIWCESSSKVSSCVAIALCVVGHVSGPSVATTTKHTASTDTLKTSMLNHCLASLSRSRRVPGRVLPQLPPAHSEGHGPDVPAGQGVRAGHPGASRPPCCPRGMP